MAKSQTGGVGPARSPAPRFILYSLFVLSGFAALVYEVLWLRELKLLFGSTAQAAGATLAVFFLGLAVGGLVGGRWAAGSARPLRLYAVAEAAVALAAALYFPISWLYQQLYSTFFGALLDAPLTALLLKIILALGLLFPAAFFLGTTLPLMGQAVVRSPEKLGRRGTWLYSLNILGAAAGVFVAGFYLPAWVGYTRSYLLAMTVTLVVAAVAWGLSRREPATGPAEPIRKPPAVSREPALDLSALYAVAFLSGLLALALEVLWTRMLTQIFHNSVYSFSAILVVFLIALSLGSGLAHLLARRESGGPMLALLMAIAGVLVGLMPFIFFQVTDALRYVGTDAGWSAYVAEIFRTVAVAVLIPGIAVGAVFPFLFKLAEGVAAVPGRVLGRLAAFNTTGAIVGALVAGFLLLGTLGLWKSIQLTAALYVLGAVLVLDSVKQKPPWLRWAPLLLIVLVAGQIAAYYYGHLSLPLTRVRPGFGETLVAEWEGSQGTVAVVERGRTRTRPGTLVMKLNNHYTLGTSASIQFERGQADLPMLIHPRPEAVFFLGMGTGVTAAAALEFPIQKLVITELVPEVVEAARSHFRQFVGGLYEDGRVRIVTEDGRNYLQATPEGFDVIISDLFLPWAAGTSSLYSREHFETVRGRLRPGGLFAQWLPLYQLSDREFSIIVRTMLEVFPQVTLWRGDFFASRPIVTLIGQEAEAQLNPEAVTRIADVRAPEDTVTPGQVFPFLLYVANLNLHRERFEAAPVNTDDRPVIEYLAPRTHRSGQEDRWLTSFRLADFYSRLRDAVPYPEDPYLNRLSKEQRDYVDAGYFFYQGAVHFYNRQPDTAKEYFEKFRERVPGVMERLPGTLAREFAGDEY